ncbi:uncharacterized protein LOC119835470 [Zerene cesonia]|uniref:uncharacterized protein LOC119835470 n=1 Tax=Zerene cesonia TaxID=33412 RepID=UPI0018E4E638|nr:uncharacterized protein LOC119835470 [Zerene cesonia]
MSDSAGFSSLFALVDSHLSKTSVKESNSDGVSRSPFQIPSLRDGPNSSSSEGRLFSPLGQRLPIPSLSLSESPITNVLAEQVANMLKAKERKQQEEEKKRMEEDMQKLKLNDDRDDYVIDLMKVLQTPYEPELKVKDEILSSSSSFESIFEPKFIDSNVEPEPLLPCITDMSYILDVKVRRGKASTFGKVLSSRLRPVAAPYLREKIESNIKAFDFSTPSPCDVFREKLRKPTMSCTYTVNIEL